MKNLLIVCISVSVLNGCASLSKQECLLGNWQVIGFSDGASGYSANRVSAHQKACAKAGVIVDYKLWEQGRQEGLLKYCTKANAYNLGKHGKQLNGVCPINTAATLQQFNQQGLRHHHLAEQINTDKKQLDTYKDELSKLREGEMLEFTTEKQARAYLLTLPNKINQLRLLIQQNQFKLQNLPTP